MVSRGAVITHVEGKADDGDGQAGPGAGSYYVKNA
jgi:hypothetical protein